MTGIIAQVIALTSFGDEFLKTGIWSTDLYPDNSAFQSCNTIDFTFIKKTFFKTKRVNIAKSPKEWLEYLKSEGCKGLKLHFKTEESLETDHALAILVGGGGMWLIESIYDDESNYWSNSWAVTNKDGDKIWGVSYIANVDRVPASTTVFNLNEVKEEFSSALKNIADFAYGQNFLGFGDIFTKANDNLFDDNSEDKKHYYKDMIDPSRYSLIAKQLIFSAKMAWVFNGMGSWIDMWIENDELKKIYNDLTAKLYHIVNKSIVAAVNHGAVAN